MDARPNLASTAFLIADATRSAMLIALLDGRAHPAGELARTAGVTAQTASSHLAKLLVGGLVAVEIEGRHRFYKLAGAHVALTLENLAAVVPREATQRKATTREAQKLRFARCCYDHLAGRLGVAVTRGLQDRRFLVPAAGRRYEVTSGGAEWFDAFGLNTTAIKPNRRGLARQCLDWTERQNHLAGPLGVQFMSLLCAKDWIRRAPSSRAVEVTPEGWKGLRREFGIEEQEQRSASPASRGGPSSPST